MKTTPITAPGARRVVFAGSPAQLQAWLPTQRAAEALRQAHACRHHRRGETLLLAGLLLLLALAGLNGCATSRPAPLYAKHPHSYPVDARVRHAEPWPSRVK